MASKAEKVFIKACKSGALEQVKNSLKEGVNVNARVQLHKGDDFEECALVAAMHHRHMTVIDVLLEHPDIDVNVPGFMNESPLMRACRLGPEALGVIKRLIDKGADINYMAVYEGEESTFLPGLITFLSGQHLDFVLEMIREQHWHDLSKSQAMQAAVTKYEEEAKALFPAMQAAGFPLEGVDEHGGTLLHLAAFYDRLFVAQWLIDHGLAIDARDHEGNTPLLLAAKAHYEGDRDQYNLIDTMQLLMDKGAHINAVNHAGKTPLMLVVGRGSAALQLCIAHGADLEAKDLKDQSTAFMQTAIHYDIASAKLLTKAGADIHAKNTFGENATDKILDLMKVIIKKDMPAAKAYLAFIRDELGVLPTK